MNRQLIKADWPAPENIIACCTSRVGGYSAERFSSLNMGHHVGDDLQAVAANRAVMQELLPENAKIQWLSQIHGTEIVNAGGEGALADYPEADACWTNEPGIACAVLSADCLPVLLCNLKGTIVAAVHAGWRGLLNGVLEQTVEAISTHDEQLLAWMGPAIGPDAFEVGPEVKSSFIDAAENKSLDEVSRCFTRSTRNPQRYMADLFALARLRLNQVGVSQIYGGGLCTYSDADRFFSYRRDGQTGRMATLICIKPS